MQLSVLRHSGAGQLDGSCPALLGFKMSSDTDEAEIRKCGSSTPLYFPLQAGAAVQATTRVSGLLDIHHDPQRPAARIHSSSAARCQSAFPDQPPLRGLQCLHAALCICSPSTAAGLAAAARPAQLRQPLLRSIQRLAKRLCAWPPAAAPGHHHSPPAAGSLHHRACTYE